MIRNFRNASARARQSCVASNFEFARSFQTREFQERKKEGKKRNASLPIDCSVNIVDTLCCDQCESSSVVAVMIRGCELLMQKSREKSAKRREECCEQRITATVRNVMAMIV